MSQEGKYFITVFHPNQAPTSAFSRSLHATRQRQKEGIEGKKESAARTPSTPFATPCSLRNHTSRQAAYQTSNNTNISTEEKAIHKLISDTIQVLLL
jgi:hypothetical protein